MRVLTLCAFAFGGGFILATYAPFFYVCVFLFVFLRFNFCSLIFIFVAQSTSFFWVVFPLRCKTGAAHVEVARLRFNVPSDVPT